MHQQLSGLCQYFSSWVSGDWQGLRFGFSERRKKSNLFFTLKQVQTLGGQLKGIYKMLDREHECPGTGDPEGRADRGAVQSTWVWNSMRRGMIPKEVWGQSSWWPPPPPHTYTREIDQVYGQEDDTSVLVRARVALTVSHLPVMSLVGYTRNTSNTTWDTCGGRNWLQESQKIDTQGVYMGMYTEILSG